MSRFVSPLIVGAVLGSLVLCGGSAFAQNKPKAAKNPAPEGQKPADAKMAAYKINDTVKDFTLMDASGKSVKLSDFSGKPVLLTFFSKGDEKVASDLEKDILSKFKGSNKIAVLGVTNDDPAKIKELADKHHISFPILIDKDDSVAKQFGVTTRPFHAIIGGNGQLKYTQTGGETKTLNEKIESFIMEKKEKEKGKEGADKKPGG
jgi:peroxiredoxin